MQQHPRYDLLGMKNEVRLILTFTHFTQTVRVSRREVRLILTFTHFTQTVRASRRASDKEAKHQIREATSEV